MMKADTPAFENCSKVEGSSTSEDARMDKMTEVLSFAAFLELGNETEQGLYRC